MTVTKIITDKKTITSITLLMDECVNFMKGQWQQHHHHDHDLLRSFPTFCWSASWSPPPRSPPRTLLMPTADGTGNPFFWTLVKFFFLAECKTKTFLQGLGLLWLLLHNSVHSRDHVENVRLWCSSKGRIYAIARFEWRRTLWRFPDFIVAVVWLWHPSANLLDMLVVGVSLVSIIFSDRCSIFTCPSLTIFPCPFRCPFLGPRGPHGIPLSVR